MATFTSMQQYRTYISKVAKNMVFEANKIDLKTVKKMKKTAKSLAPVSSGKTKAGIKFRKTKSGYRLISTVSGSFKQNMFANRTNPYRTINIKKTNRFYKGGQTVIYGGPAKSPSGKQIRWTGKPGFFDLAIRESIPGYRNELKKLTSRAVAKSK